jgi:hypothetical protein
MESFFSKNNLVFLVFKKRPAEALLKTLEKLNYF